MIDKLDARLVIAAALALWAVLALWPFVSARAVGFAGGAFLQGTGETVPDVVGSSDSAATTSITGASLTKGTVTTQCSNQAAGIVLVQSPAAGQVVVSGRSVNLFESSGSKCSAGRAHLHLLGGPRIGI